MLNRKHVGYIPTGNKLRDAVNPANTKSAWPVVCQINTHYFRRFSWAKTQLYLQIISWCAGELQAGFRSGRRIEDNLFVLTQCVEIAQQAQRPLYVSFLDIAKAYDLCWWGALSGPSYVNWVLVMQTVSYCRYCKRTWHQRWSGRDIPQPRCQCDGGFGRVVHCHHCCSWCMWQVWQSPWRHLGLVSR